MSDAAIELRGVHKAFRDNAVLRGLDLSIPEGHTTTILGGSARRRRHSGSHRRTCAGAGRRG